MQHTNLWPSIEPLLAHVERPARYLNHEWGAAPKHDADFSFCMVYPDTYELGQANQAVRILVNCVNHTPHLAAERAFLPAPDMIGLMREAGLPLFSLESMAPLAEFDSVGITLPHELAATNVLETLDLAGIPLRSQDRGEEHPFVLGGGPCAYNPEPYAPFFDAITIGEGEEATPQTLLEIRRCRQEGLSRTETLRQLAKIPGTYVPSLYRWRTETEAQEAGSWVEPLVPEASSAITKRIFTGFADSDAYEPCIVPYTEVVHDRLNVEVLRGCARGCRFCQAGMMYRPVRERSADNVVNAVVRGLRETGYDEVSLYIPFFHRSLPDRLDPGTAQRGVRRLRRAHFGSLPTVGFLRGGNGWASGWAEERGSDVRPGGGHPKAARRHQQERHRGRPVRRHRCCFLGRLAPLQAVFYRSACPPRPTTT